MKKIFITTLFICFAHVCTVNAENAYRPYIGADISYNRAKTNFVKPDYYAAMLNLGTTYNTYFGTEIFYQQAAARTETVSTGQKYKTSFRGYGLDAIITAPVFSKFDAHFSLGLASYVFSERFSDSHRMSDEGIGYRFGVGATYHLTNRLATRFNARYIKFNDISNLKHAAEYSLGLRYYLTEN